MFDPINAMSDPRMQEYDWRLDDKISVYSNIYAFLYFCLADEAIQRFGDAGAEAVGEGLRRYGSFRGALLRTMHIKKGLEISVENFGTHYDLPKDERSDAKCFVRTKTCSYSEYYSCQFSDIWKILEGIPLTETSRIGKLYCDNFHPAMWDGYCHGMRIEIPKMITCQDNYCIFLTHMDQDADTDPTHGILPEADAINWNFDEPVAAIGNIYCMMYFFVADAICRAFGEEGEASVRQGLLRYGHLRGQMLAWNQRRAGYEINVLNFFNHYDLPSDSRTTRNRWLLTESEAESKNFSCQMADIWKLLEGVPIKGGVTKIGTMYCQVFHPAMWEGYRSDMHVELSEAFSYGDDCCHFRTYLEAK